MLTITKTCSSLVLFFLWIICWSCVEQNLLKSIILSVNFKWLMFSYSLKPLLKLLQRDNLLSKQPMYNLLKIFLHEDVSLGHTDYPPLSDLYGCFVCLASYRSEVYLHYNEACLWMPSLPRWKSVLLKGRAEFWKLTIDFQFCFICCLWKHQAGRSLRVFYFSRSYSLFLSSSLSQSSYSMSWPSSRTQLLCR